jgi:predicted DNA binding CopG/RHH family protein
MSKPWPVLSSDEEAERFVAEADLSEYDFAQMVPIRFELRRKDKAVSLRLSDALLAAVKQEAARQGMPYQRFMRLAIERAVGPGRTPERAERP